MCKWHQRIAVYETNKPSSSPKKQFSNLTREFTLTTNEMSCECPNKSLTIAYTTPNPRGAVLNGTSNIVIKSKLPPGVTRAQGIRMLHDKDFFINCDPHLAKYEATGEVADPDALPARAQRGTAAGRPTYAYKILDVVPNVPKAVWGSEVQSTYEFTDVERGLFCRIRSPLNVHMEALWEIRDADDGGLELVEDADIRCSKLLLGLVKSQCEAGGACFSSFFS